MHVTKPIDLPLLQQELGTAGIAVSGLGTAWAVPNVDGEVFTYDGDGAIVDLPPDAQPVVDAHVAPPRVVEFAGHVAVDALTRTTDAAPKEVFRFPCAAKHIYRASLVITGVDSVSGAIKVMDGRFVWKRPGAASVMVGITVVSDIHDTAAASWAPNAIASGTDIIFTVAGAAGRTIDWLLVGDVSQYAPEGL